MIQPEKNIKFNLLFSVIIIIFVSPMTNTLSLKTGNYSDLEPARDFERASIKKRNEFNGDSGFSCFASSAKSGDGIFVQSSVFTPNDTIVYARYYLTDKLNAEEIAQHDAKIETGFPEATGLLHVSFAVEGLL